MTLNFMRWSLTTLFHYRAKVRHEVVRSHKVCNPYHAVGIASGANACTAARSLRDQRFLSSEAPRLPLAACNMESCTCRYQHHTDRRSGERRQSALLARSWNGVDRRRTPGRRITDS